MTLSLLAAALLAATPAPFTAQDLVTLQRVQSPRSSPDGRRIAFVVRSTDLDANRGRTDLWLVNADGTGLRQLTNAPESEDQPVWTPDGKAVLFLSSKGGSSQVWRVAADGGTPEQVTKLPLDVGAFALSPDGQTLAVALEVFPDCPTLACTTKKLEEQKAHKGSGRTYDELLYRHWDTWSDGRRNHLFALPLAGGEARDLMPGMKADAPSKPFGGAEEFTFTPDSRAVVFTAREAGREEAWSTDLDLWQAQVAGGAAPQKLTTKNRATDTSPAFSPDGKWLAYLAMARPGYESDRLRVVLRDWKTGEERVLTQKWDRSAGTLAWTRDSATLLTSADNLGQHTLYALDVKTGEARVLAEQGYNADAQPTADGRVVYLHDDLDSPADVWSVKLDGQDARQQTHFNQEALARVRFGEFEQFSFKGHGGETVRGYVVKPVGFQAGQKYPVALIIHGGPQGSMGNHFHYRWNPQPYAGAGYGVVFIDFHGSTGYGQAFTDSIRDDWGGKPLEDLKKGFAQALQKNPWLDGGRACALGASYGGYMINWIAGNWGGPFKCLVNHDGIFDTRTGYYDTEEVWFPEWEHGGTPWEQPAKFEKHNPSRFVKNWKTPMLVVQGGKDFRVVETQAMSTFTALQRRGIPSRFLYFPDENHWVLKPHNSLQWHAAVLDWLSQWTGTREGRPAAPASR